MTLTVENQQFPTNWQAKDLGDLCEVISGQHIAAKDYNTENRGIAYLTGPADFGTLYPVISKWTEFPKKTASRGDILITVKGSGVGKINILDAEEVAISRQLMAIRTIDVDRDFLYAFLKLQLSFFQGLANGAAIPGLSRQDILGLSVPTPPIAEQKRIVAILDEAFEGIDSAIANTEKNLANARELFESYLNSLDAEKRSLGDLVDIRTGKLNANTAVDGGQYPFFTCSKEIYQIDDYAFDCEAILLAGNNAVGDFNVKHYRGKFNAYQRTYVITVNQNEEVLYRYLYFQLLKSLKEFKSKSVGAGTRFLKLGMIKDLQISLPSLDEQETIVSVLDELEEAVQDLEAIYRRKLAALNELKQSILQKAFSGELTAEVRDAAVAGAKEVVAA